MRPPPPGAAPSTLALVGIASAAALVPLNSTMIAVALPRVAEQFAISPGAASVLITVYLVAMLVGQPIAGHVSDRVGSRRTVIGALSGFAVCSLLAAAAPSFSALVAARGVQAVFASALVPSVQALLRAATPGGQRGRVFGIFGSVLGVGAAGGPVVGGLLVAAFGWPAIFVVNVPVAGAAVLACVVAAPVRSPVMPAGSRDGGGEPLTNAVFLSAFGVQALTTLAQYALLLVTPVMLHQRGWSPGGIGLVLSALTVGMIVVGPAGGRAGDRLGRRSPVLAGLAVATVAVATAAAAGSTVGPALLVCVLALFGFGLGFATPGVTTAGLESVPEDRTGSAGGVLSTSRYVGSITTSLAMSAFVAADGGGIGTVLVLSLLAMIGALLLAVALPGRGATPVPPPVEAVA